MNGGLVYPVLTHVAIIGTKSGTTITPVALTSSYNATVSGTVPCGGASALVINAKYTTGAAETNNSIEIKMEASNDGTNFFQLTNEAASGGTSTITQRELTFVGASAATAYSVSYKLDVAYKFLKLSVKESGVAANAGTIYVEGLLAGY